MVITGITDSPAGQRLVEAMSPRERALLGFIPVYGEHAPKHGDNAIPYTPKLQRRFEDAYELCAAKCLIDNSLRLSRMKVVETPEEVWWYAFADGVR